MYIVVIAGPDKGREVKLVPGSPLCIGRSKSAQLPLTDETASRTHCTVELRGRTAVVEDQQSRSGTFVNKVRVTTAELKPGDVIRLGQTQLRYQLESAAIPEASTLAPPKAPAVPGGLAALVGQTLSHYDVQKILAKGQSSMVFLAQDQKKGRLAALKVLWPEVASDDEQMRRFVRGMRAAFPVRHENIVRLYDARKTGRFAWLAMEYVEGESLRAVIRRIGVAGMLDWKQAFWVAVQIARALEVAAEHQMVHRNLTPGNILLRKLDNVAKLSDLMLAKVLDGAGAEAITAPGDLVGDLPYMAPERTVAGAPLDGRSDIYGLGATLYALLTGRPPHEAETAYDLVQKIRNQPPDDPRRFQLSVPDAFAGVVMQMLAKRPEDRFENATCLLKDLARVGLFQGLTI